MSDPRNPADVYAHNRQVALGLVDQIKTMLDKEPTGHEDWADVGDIVQTLDYLIDATEWME